MERNLYFFFHHIGIHMSIYLEAAIAAVAYATGPSLELRIFVEKRRYERR